MLVYMKTNSDALLKRRIQASHSTLQLSRKAAGLGSRGVSVWAQDDSDGKKMNEECDTGNGTRPRAGSGQRLMEQNHQNQKRLFVLLSLFA